MKDMNQHIESLLLKQLQHELSPEEQHDLEQWLKADPANREEYARLERIWEASTPALNSHVFDTAAAWTKVNEQLRTRVIPMVPAGRTGPGIAVRFKWIAAACLLFCVAGWWYKDTHRETTIVAAEGNRIITFPDSTIICLRKGSTLLYPEALANGRGERVVQLQGEAFFDVRHDPARPFRVSTHQASIEDLGTSFCISEKDTVCEVVVTAGMVKCTARQSPAELIVISAGQRVRLGTDRWIRQTPSDPNFLSWKSHTLEFNQSPLDSVLSAVQDLYGVPLTIASELRGMSDNIRVTARFNAHQQLQDVLEEIRLTTGLGMQKKKDTTIFFRK